MAPSNVAERKGRLKRLEEIEKIRSDRMRHEQISSNLDKLTSSNVELHAISNLSRPTRLTIAHDFRW